MKVGPDQSPNGRGKPIILSWQQHFLSRDYIFLTCFPVVIVMYTKQLEHKPQYRMFSYVFFNTLEQLEHSYQGHRNISKTFRFKVATKPEFISVLTANFLQ